jgi:hypothetical protein
MKIELGPCKLAHLRSIKLRAGDLAELTAGGRQARHVLFDLWRSTDAPRAALVDGEVAAIWGCGGALLAPEGEPWLFTGYPVERAPLTFIKVVKGEIEEMLQTRTTLLTACLASYHNGLRLLDILGFELGPPEGLGPYDKLFRPASRGRQVAARTKNTPVSCPPFVIFGLCRSRTRWLSEFLSYRDWSCFHEQAMFMREISDLRRFLATPYMGTAETSVSLGWRLIRHANPETKLVVIRRPIMDARDAMLAAYDKAKILCDRAKLDGILVRSERALEDISAQPGTLTMAFADLATERGARTVFEHCLPFDFDHSWWLKHKDKVIQIDLPSMVQYHWQNKAGIENFKRLCKRELIRLARTGEFATWLQ